MNEAADPGKVRVVNKKVEAPQKQPDGNKKPEKENPAKEAKKEREATVADKIIQIAKGKKNRIETEPEVELKDVKVR